MLDKQQISLDLEKYSEVFYHFWEFCNIEETKAIPTAAVSFDKYGKCLRLSINPDFWASQTYTQQLFILCHEMLHVYYKHGAKAKSLIKAGRSDLMQIANIAMDLCVNRVLTTSFGFNRAEIDPENKYCWIDTVFPNNPEDPEKYFEYYYNKIKDNAKVITILTSGKGKGNQLVDSHDGLGELEEDEVDKIIEEISKKVFPQNAKDFVEKTKNGEEDKKPSNSKKAGTQAGGNSLKVRADYKPRAKWESVVRQWCKKALSDSFNENWTRPNRRTMFLDMGGLLLPSENDFAGGKDLEKIKVAFFMDVSGSTYHLAERFFVAASTVPKHRFDVDLYQFDTVVRKLEDGNVIGGGGTSYRVISDHINKMEKEGVLYDSIWILTDSFGDGVSPKYPDRWHWFLTPGSQIAQLPENCNYYNLSEFE